MKISVNSFDHSTPHRVRTALYQTRTPDHLLDEELLNNSINKLNVSTTTGVETKKKKKGTFFRKIKEKKQSVDQERVKID